MPTKFILSLAVLFPVWEKELRLLPWPAIKSAWLTCYHAEI